MNEAQMYAKMLESGQSNYDSTREAGKNLNKPLDTGTYKVQLQKATMGHIDTKDGVALLENFQWLVLEGDQKGRVCYTNLFLSGDKSDIWIHAFFSSLDMDAPATKGELPKAFEALVKKAPIVEARITCTEDGYNRIRVKEVLDASKSTPTSSGKGGKGKAAGSIPADLAKFCKEWEFTGSSQEELIATIRESCDGEGNNFDYEKLDDGDKAVIEAYELTDCVDGWPQTAGSEEPADDILTFVKAYGYKDIEGKNTDQLVQMVRDDQDNDGKPYDFNKIDDDDKAVMEAYDLWDKVCNRPAEKGKGKTKGKSK